MLFNSSEFFYFFIFIYLAYLILPHRGQNLLLLLASYYFYAAWDARFLLLIVVSTLIDYAASHRIADSHEREDEYLAQRWMWLSVASNLSILGFFKYFNFFSDSFQALFATIGIELGNATLEIILPVGISFYTFQTMSYSIDVYRKRQKPCGNFFNFALFVAFFPQLMAGPIERARKLLPQLESKRIVSMDDVRYGSWLILWGLFKKIYIGDNLFYYSDWIFGRGIVGATGAEFWLGAVAFSTALYCDFSGYSDMARGLARLLGVKLSINFNLPFWSTNPSEFWRRWHITLMSWFRDYVYASLGGGKKGRFRGAFNLFTVFCVSGLWHGADWKFFIWGAIWGLVAAGYTYVAGMPSALIGVDSAARRLMLKVGGWLFIMSIWLSTAPLFIAGSTGQALQAIDLMFTDFSPHKRTAADTAGILFYILPLFLMEFWQYRSRHLDVVMLQPLPVRFIVYGLLLILLFVGGVPIGRENIYFQF